MGDAFFEEIVTRAPRTSDHVKRAGLILLTTVLLALGLLFHPLFLLAGVVMIFVDTRLFRRFHVEYEYAYVNGQLDIAAVYSGESRKNLCTVELTEAECVAPSGSDHLREFGDTYQITDYSSGYEENRPYAIVMGKERQIILANLSGEMIEDLRWRLPRKVFTD